MKMPQLLLIGCILSIMLAPAVQAAANLDVTGFSCSPDEVKLGDQFTCTATVQNAGDVSGTLKTATLYPDSNNWLENSNYPVTINTALASGASTQVTFNNMKGKKSGNNGFSKIMIDDVTDTYVADNSIAVNIIDIIVIATASSSSAASGAAVDVTAQATVGGNVDTTISFSISGTGCNIGSQASSATASEMTNGQSSSHTWTVTIGSNNCSYTITAQAISNPGSDTSKTDTASGRITCSNCNGTTETTTSTSTGSGGGGGGGVAGESQTVSKELIKKGEKSSFMYSIEILGITQVDVTANNDMTQIELKVSRYTALPSSISTAPSNNVYKYIEFKPTNLSSVDNIEISFKVNKTWVSNNNQDPDKIYLYRYTDQWNKLTTVKTLTDDKYYYYKSSSSGFSYFAIAGEPLITIDNLPEDQIEQAGAAENIQNITTNTPAEEKKAKEILKEIPTDYLMIGVVLIIILLLGWFYYHGHKRLKK